MVRLHDVQRQLNLPLYRLIRDCETRWSSTYDMIARYIEQFPAIQLVCSEEAFLHPTLSAVDLQELKKLRDLLKPFAEITTLMSSETNVTASSVRCFFNFNSFYPVIRMLTISFFICLILENVLLKSADESCSIWKLDIIRLPGFGRSCKCHACFNDLKEV
jgi:hypothetical protein